jgi:hypothetical protein
MNKLDEALGLFPSVIKCGEQWSATCQSALDGAKAELAALRAAPQALAATPTPDGAFVTNDVVIKMMQWPACAKYDLAFKLAENVGYTLVRDAEHPDSPHLAATPALGGERADLIRRLRQHDGHLGLLVEEAADALAAQPASPLRGREAVLTTSGLNDVNETTANYARLKELEAASASPLEQPAAIEALCARLRAMPSSLNDACRTMEEAASWIEAQSEPKETKAHD